VRAATPSQLTRLFEIVLRHKITCTGCWLPELWEALLTSAPDAATRNGWLDRMADASPAILDDLSDIRLWIPHHERELLDRLPIDHTLVQLVEMLGDLALEKKTPSFVENSVSPLAHFFRSKPPRLAGTCNCVQALLSTLTVRSPELDATIESRRRAILEESRNLRRRPNSMTRRCQIGLRRRCRLRKGGPQASLGLGRDTFQCRDESRPR